MLRFERLVSFFQDIRQNHHKVLRFKVGCLPTFHLLNKQESESTTKLDCMQLLYRLPHHPLSPFSSHLTLLSVRSSLMKDNYNASLSHSQNDPSLFRQIYFKPALTPSDRENILMSRSVFTSSCLFFLLLLQTTACVIPKLLIKISIEIPQHLVFQ